MNALLGDTIAYHLKGIAIRINMNIKRDIQKYLNNTQYTIQYKIDLLYRCDNTIGSYACVRVATCGTGYTLSRNTGMCVDDDECRYKSYIMDKSKSVRLIIFYKKLKTSLLGNHIFLLL